MTLRYFDLVLLSFTHLPCVHQKLFSLAVMFNLIHIHIAPIQNTTKILSWHRYVCGFAGQRPETPGGLGLIWLPLTLSFFSTLLGIFRGYKRFFKRAMLESSDFVKDDTLKICCTVGVVVSAIQGPRLHYIHIPESNLGQKFGELLEDVENADVTFDVSGEKFHACLCPVVAPLACYHRK